MRCADTNVQRYLMLSPITIKRGQVVPVNYCRYMYVRYRGHTNVTYNTVIVQKQHNVVIAKECGSNDLTERSIVHDFSFLLHRYVPVPYLIC